MTLVLHKGKPAVYGDCIISITSMCNGWKVTIDLPYPLPEDDYIQESFPTLHLAKSFIDWLTVYGDLYSWEEFKAGLLEPVYY